MFIYNVCLIMIQPVKNTLYIFFYVTKNTLVNNHIALNTNMKRQH